MYSKEDAHERLHGLEIFVRAQAGGQGVEIESEVIEGDERTDLQVECWRGERFCVLEERIVYAVRSCPLSETHNHRPRTPTRVAG